MTYHALTEDNAGTLDFPKRITLVTTGQHRLKLYLGQFKSCIVHQKVLTRTFVQKQGVGRGLFLFISQVRSMGCSRESKEDVLPYCSGVLFFFWETRITAFRVIFPLSAGRVKFVLSMICIMY